MVCHFFVFFAVAENFRLCFSVLFCLSLVLFFCQVVKNFRLRFLFLGLLFCQVAKFFRLCFSFLFLFFQVVFFFLFLFSFSGSVFLCQAVAEIFMLYSFVFCVLCSCQAMFFCLVPFVFVRLCSFVRWLKFSSCGFAVFCSG